MAPAPADSNPKRLIGNLVALVVLAPVVALLVDIASGWLGLRLGLFCGALGFVSEWALLATLVLTFVGFVLYLLSGFKAGAGAGAWLFWGGLALSVIPMVLPHYLGTSC